MFWFKVLIFESKESFNATEFNDNLFKPSTVSFSALSALREEASSTADLTSSSTAFVSTEVLLVKRKICANFKDGFEIISEQWV